MEGIEDTNSKPERPGRSLDEILKDLAEKSSPDLSVASDTERAAIFKWYSSNQLSEQEQTDFLEEFMLYGLVDDATALAFIRSMNQDQKAQLGEYLGRVIKPGIYVQSFYECLPEVDFNTRENILASLCADPKAAIMVAPFRDLRNIPAGEIKNEYGHVSRKTVLESEFGSIEEAYTLIDALLQYYEDHPDIQGYALNPGQESSIGHKSRVGHTRLNRFYSGPARNLEDIVNHFFRNKAIVLYPYIERLYDLGFLSDDHISSLFEVRDQNLIDQTREEEAEIKRLTKKLKGSEDEFFYFFSASENVPQKYGLRIEEIIDRGKVRSAESILRHFQQHRKRFGFDHTKFLMELIERGVPVFCQVEELGISKEEVRTLLVREYQEEGILFNLHGYGDMKALLEWNRQQKDSDGSDLEKIVMDLLIQDITEGGERLGVHLRDILSWFEEHSRSKIIKTINQRAPQLWLLNLNYAIEHAVMPLNELVVESSQKNHSLFLSHFNVLLYHISILKKQGKEVPVELEEIRKIARNILLENPYYFLSKNSQYIVEQVFTEEERNNFIRDQLNKEPIDQSFLSTLIRQDVEGKYASACHDILMTNPLVFAEHIEHASSKIIYRILSISEVTDLLIKAMDSLDFTYVIKEDLVLYLLESPLTLERLMTALQQSNNATGLVILAKTLDRIQENKSTSMQTWESDMAMAKNDLKALFSLQNSVSAAEKKELQLLIDKKRAHVSRLEKNRPKERITEQGKVMARDYRDQLKEVIIGLCESERFLVFHEGVLDLLDDDARDLVKRGIDEYIAIHPEVLMRQYSRYGDKRRGKLIFEELLGKEEFARLFRSRIHTLAFWSTRYRMGIDTTILPGNLAEEVESINPLLLFQRQKHLKEDFYETIRGRARYYNFYPLYADRLVKIAAEEMGIYGPRLDIESLQPKEEFVTLAKTIFLLEASDVAIKNKEAIVRLPAQQREEFTKVLGFLSMYHLDEHVDFDLTEENYSEVREQMFARILEFCKKLFEMEDAEITMSDTIDIDTIHALSKYYENCRENPSMKRAFHHMMIPVLGGYYNSWRAWAVKEPPVDDSAGEECLESLKTRGYLPKNLSLEQYKKWLEDEDLNFSETFAFQISDIQSGIRDIFSLAVVDGHIEETTLHIDGFVLASDYHVLILPLKELAQKQQEYKQRIELSKRGDVTQELTGEEKQEYEANKRKIKEYRESHETEIKRIEALRYLDRIQKMSIEELELQCIFVDRKRISFTDVFETLEEAFSDKPDFLSDIRRVRQLLTEGNRQIFQGGRVSRSRLTITDRVDLETHVYIGEKPVESCQHYDGSDLSYGLLSYISDPAIKIGQIRDENGNIIARAIFRLMEDENQKPQLFMERVYSVNSHPKIKEAMIRFAIQKAQSLGMGIYTQEEEHKELVGERTSDRRRVVLHSKGSRGPYTYTDAGGGRVPGGIFTVEVYN